MKGYIGFRGYEINCVIGVYPYERLNPQTIYIDLVVETDFSKCIESDNLEDTVNYEQLAEICKVLAINKKYRLLETFAAEALQEIFRQFKVPKASIFIKKPNALTLADCSTVELELINDAY